MTPGAAGGRVVKTRSLLPLPPEDWDERRGARCSGDSVEVESALASVIACVGSSISIEVSRWVRCSELAGSLGKRRSLPMAAGDCLHSVLIACD
jgi:hypothetical protein